MLRAIEVKTTDGSRAVVRVDAIEWVEEIREKTCRINMNSAKSIIVAETLLTILHRIEMAEMDEREAEG